MRTLIISASLALALLTAADAAPLYLKCEGKDSLRSSASAEGEPGTHSIKIDGSAVEVDGIPAGKIIDSLDHHIWSFGNEKDLIAGTVDRITGGASLTWNFTAAKTDPPDPLVFTGACRKAGKLF